MDVYKGVWYDHASHKLILTLSPGSAGFLTAAVVTWVNICAAATWPIFRYILYSIRKSVDTNKDVFHHQRQTLLRNSTSATSAAGQLISQIYGWKSYRLRAITRSILYLVACTIIFVLFLLCGLYAPYIYTKTGSDVLIAPSAHCGTPVPPTLALSDASIMNLFNSQEVSDQTAARGYVDECYGRSLANNSQCENYPRQALPFQTSDAICPFGTKNDGCRSVNSTTIRLDTGLLDSNADFGVNTFAIDSLKYRKVATCSPIQSSLWGSTFNTSGTSYASQYPPNSLLFRYWFGSYVGNNFTYEYNTYQALFPLPYYLSAILYSPTNDPIEDQWMLNTTLYGANDSDVTLAYLEANHITYQAPVYDPVFAAGIDPGEMVQEPFNKTLNYTIYFPHYPVVNIGCLEQYQICLTDSGACTPLVPQLGLLGEVAKLKGLRPAHVITSGRLSLGTGKSSISEIAAKGGGNALLASRTVDDLGQTAQLPPDQWRKEVTNWFSVGLARLQGHMLTFATGPSNPAFYSYLNITSMSREHGCNNQRVRSPSGHVNFDFTALIVLIAVGAAFILSGLLFETVVGWIASRKPAWKKSFAIWTADGLLQVQRRALEAKGIKGWKHTDSNVPVSGEKVGFMKDSMEHGVVSESLLNEGKH